MRAARLAGVVFSCLLISEPVSAQEARRRWEQMCQIRKDKFDYILPQAMRENGIGMWIVICPVNNRILLIGG
jgi:hypothetical protein